MFIKLENAVQSKHKHLETNEITVHITQQQTVNRARVNNKKCQTHGSKKKVFSFVYVLVILIDTWLRYER